MTDDNIFSDHSKLVISIDRIVAKNKMDYHLVKQTNYENVR